MTSLGTGAPDVVEPHKQEWAKMLAGSDCFCDGSDELFVVHTVLVNTSRLVVASLYEQAEDTAFDFLDDGFSSWFLQVDDGGYRWGQKLHKIIGSFDWRKDTRDMLGELHHSLLSIYSRKEQGEHYTPVWIAEAMGEEVLDDDWLAQVVDMHKESKSFEGVGVLDPTCGSGILLMEAARRVREALDAHDISHNDQTAIIRSLISGIDIHPVTVEMARANFLRVLPSLPAPKQSENIIWGDALLADPYIYFGDDRPVVEPLDMFGEPSDASDSIRIPLEETEDALSIDFNPQWLNTISQWEHMPTMKDVVESLAWRYKHSIGSLNLLKQKVDRMVGNPPWLRLNVQPDSARTRSMEDLARRYNLLGGATVNSSFNMAALFVVRCRELYLADSALGKARASWVLPWGAVGASTWEPTRKLLDGKTQSVMWDMSELVDRPFPSAISSIWHQRNAVAPKVTTTISRILNKPQTDKVAPTDNWIDVQRKILWAGPRQGSKGAPTPKPSISTYPAFRHGATLFPSNLLRINKIQSLPGNEYEIETVTARHAPWRAVGSHKGVVPAVWVHNVMFASDLIAFHGGRPSRAVIPLTPQDTPDVDGMASIVYWLEAEALWQSRRGRGQYTPKTLWDRANHHNGITMQRTQSYKHSWKVLSSTCGERLRAARVPASYIIDNALYYFQCSSYEEAGYLTALINSEYMHKQYLEKRRSDRQCGLSFWGEVQIPKYNSGDECHRALVEYCGKAETYARKQETTNPHWVDASQVKQSEIVRTGLKTLESPYDAVGIGSLIETAFNNRGTEQLL